MTPTYNVECDDVTGCHYVRGPFHSRDDANYIADKARVRGFHNVRITPTNNPLTEG